MTTRVSIAVETPNELVELTAGYIREGLTFEVDSRGAGTYVITLTGGY